LAKAEAQAKSDLSAVALAKSDLSAVALAKSDLSAVALAKSEALAKAEIFSGLYSTETTVELSIISSSQMMLL
jgi:hypothetical protein